MKSAFALSALVALWQPVVSQLEGVYTIGSAALDTSLVLGEAEADRGRLQFAPQDGSPGQNWTLSLTDPDSTDFIIINNLGSYINCGDKVGSVCFASADPRIYSHAPFRNGKHGFVDRDSDNPLRVNADRNIELADGGQSLDYQFTLNP